MSVKVMSWVWEQDLSTTKKMLLLAIADHADDEGENAWPSKARLALKCNISESQVRRHLRELEADGWIATERQRGGTLATSEDRRPNLYRVLVERGRMGAPPTDQRGRMGAPSRGRTDAPSRGRMRAPLTISNTSDTSSSAQPRATERRDVLFETLCEVCDINPERLTISARGALNRALKELRLVEADPGSIVAAAIAFRKRYADASLTPAALAKHYPTLDKSQSVTERSNADTREPCDTCVASGWVDADDGDGVVRCLDCGGSGRLENSGT